MDLNVAAFAQIGRADGDARRHAEPGQSLLGGGGVRGQFGRLVNPH